MKKNYRILVIIFLSLLSSRVAFSQIVGGPTGNGYLQGQWLEIGEQTNGSFGAETPPAGYHAHCAGCWPYTAVQGIAEVYDYGHDGWTVGTPPEMGDYTLPGTPFEGWEMQMNGGRAQMYQSGSVGTTFTGGGTLTGSGLTTYSNTGGTVIVNWSGTYNYGGQSLLINQETRVDTEASWVVMTAKMYNTSATTINGIYYLRTCDPDNDETWPGGAFATTNIVDYQNDADHRVLVEATGQTGTYTRWGLGTKDCRAVAFVYNSWPLTIGQDLGAIWTQTYGPADYTVGTLDVGDIGIGLVFNVGSISAGDSAVISCAYIFGANTTTTLIDSAFPDPAVTIGGASVAYQTPPAPGPVYDTFNVCALPGTTEIPIDLLYGADKSWTWATWTWSPSLGLASTTGVDNIIYTTVLPPVFTYTVTGVDSATCEFRTMYLTLLTCNTTRNNSPCEGDTLTLERIGDSTGCTYIWYGPGGFSPVVSTLQDPFIFPATYADSGEFYVVRTRASGVHDTDSTHVYIRTKPVITATSNAPLCQGMIDTLALNATPAIPGETWSWTGPAGFTSTLQNPFRPGYISIDTGVYYAYVTTTFGCKDTAQTDAGIIQQPRPPIVTDPIRYCQGDTYVPYTIDSIVTGGRILWYPSFTAPIGDTLTSEPTVNTAVPGIYTVYYSQKSGACESLRDSFTNRVYTTPNPPTATGNFAYCQYLGSILDTAVDTLTIAPSYADSINWYFVPTGGSALISWPGHNEEPLPSIRVSGVYNYWISQTDSGCESARTPVTITINPKPLPPIITPTPNCQFLFPMALNAGPDTTGVGTTLLSPTPFLWYGPGVTAGTSVTPYPQTTIAPDTEVYYVTETTIYGCISDSAVDVNVIKVQPPPPATRNTAYCQYSPVSLMNGLVDSIGNSHLNWYYNSVPATPLPFSDTAPGIYTWYVSQTVPSVAGCESDSAAVSVTIIYKPVFNINVSAAYVCQFDSLTLSYSGTQLFAPSYTWVLPQGAVTADGTTVLDSMIVVAFDSSNQNNYVYLTATDDSGFCSTQDTVRINVISQPVMADFSQPDVCLGDTVQLALSDRSNGAYTFTWYVDNVLLSNSAELSVIASNSNSGGPYSISWLDTGMHVIKVTSVSQEGCKSYPAYDSVNVHPHPNATFIILAADSANMLCLQDSVLFEATATNYNYSYLWAPASYFENVNSPKTWGTMDNSQSTVILTVTDPYGCYASSSQTLDPQTCCSVIFPNAFTPGGSINKVFEPIMTGYHMFHIFRIVNRWGITVFEGANSDAKWDGTFNGTPQDMGTYFYYLKYDCGGKTIEAKGDVTLIR